MYQTKCLFKNTDKKGLNVPKDKSLKGKKFIDDCEQIFGKRYKNIVMSSQKDLVPTDPKLGDNKIQDKQIPSLSKIKKKKNEINYQTIGSFVR